MEYSYMKARQGDVFERHYGNRSKRYVVIDYTPSVVRSVALDCMKIWQNKVSLKNFSYEELNGDDYELLDIR